MFSAFIILRYSSLFVHLQKLLLRVLGALLVPQQRVPRQEHEGQAAEVDEEDVRPRHALVQPAEFQLRFLAVEHPATAREILAVAAMISRALSVIG